jgi:hypothetical protein
VATAVLLLGALAACGEGAVSTQPTQPPRPQGSDLAVTVRASATSAPTTWSLTCDPPGGTHPDPAGACQALAGARSPFAETPRQQACTEIYGGDQLAEIAGTWRGEPVQASYSRANGCEIGRWDVLAAVFPIRVGVDFPRATG